jgi:hypothetical protein
MHEQIVGLSHSRQEDSVFEYATARSSPVPYRGTRSGPPLKPVNDLDWTDDADLLREIMR